MTLMAVRRICASVDCSTKDGASWWIARLPADLIGPASSTGSPITFMMRPKVPSPIGTEIACPVSETSLPRTRPSVESIATVRTVDSPRCCATSRIRRQPLGEDFGFAGFVFIECSGVLGRARWGFDGGRDQALSHRLLRDHRLELRVADCGDVECAFFVQLQHAAANLGRIGKGHALHMAHLDRVDDALTVEPAQLISAFSADAEDLHVFAVAQESFDQQAGATHDVRVEASAQPTVCCGDDDELHLLGASAAEKLRRAGIAFHRT